MKKETAEIDFYLLIPCYNDLDGLILSLKSINYPYNKFIVLIIDDGSAISINYTELSPHISPELVVEIIRLPVNQGIVRALNTGLEWLNTKGEHVNKYVARLDCGDICDRKRFYQQVDFFNHHPEINLIGSWCVFKDFENGNSYLYKTPTGHKGIEKEMHFRNIFIHPTVMWRTTAMDSRFYPEEFPHAEDYGLFYALIHDRVKCAILPEPLMICRISRVGISIWNRKEQLQSRMKLVKQYGKSKILKLLGILKLKLLMLIPYQFILRTKMILHKTNASLA